MRTPPSLRLLGVLAVAGLGAATFAPLGCGGGSEGLVSRDAGGVVVPPIDEETDSGTIGPVDPGNDDAGGGGPVTDAGGGGPVFADADIVPDASGCTTTPPVRGPYPRVCKPATTNECDGRSDFAGAPNGGTGNGFDDDCDGLVDEGCGCPSPGVTKTCFLVSGGQIDPATREPVGWCKAASRGTVDCVGQEFPKWSGVCRGASPPFQDDKCAPGDYDCDGRELNSFTKDCTCQTDAVTCPTTPFETVPYPNPQNLPLKIDASQWFGNPANAAQATNWKWTLRGGDCDNIQPHPSFGIYKTNNATGAPLGRTVTNLGRASNEKGREVTQGQDGVTSVVYPAFSLSGDYIMDVSLQFGGQTYTCSLNIKAKAPGVRAEACWDTMGNTDVDLHMVKVNGLNCPTPGWSGTCAHQDCLWSNCRPDATGMTRWYSASPTSACVGWGSLAAGACPNPRLDRDNISCNTAQQNPAGSSAPPIPFPIPLPPTSDFCGSENINVDAPQNGDTFAVGTVLYSGTSAKPHINIYCNGQRVVSAGYNPLTGSNFPVLRDSGANDGDFWKFGLVKVNGSGANITCDVTTTKSTTPIANKDGSTSYCVDKNASNSTKNLWKNTSVANTADGLCFH
jgi:hypothetical protein